MASSTRSATRSPASTPSRCPRRRRKPPRSDMQIRSQIVGCGGYLPERVVTNDELARRLDTSDEWIVQRTGIRQRHIAAEGELCSDLARRAAEQALAASRLAPGGAGL